MNSGKAEPENEDGHILLEPKSISAEINNKKNLTPSQSKIPKPDIGKPLHVNQMAKGKRSTKPSKLMDIKKSCQSTMSLGISNMPRSGLTSRSCMNTQRSTNVTPRSPISERTSDKIQKPSASERVIAKNHLQAFKCITAKIENCQTEFFKMYEHIKDKRLPNEGVYKFISLSWDNGKWTLVTKNKQKVSIKCDVKSLEDLKNELRSYVDYIFNIYVNSQLDHVKNESGNIGDSRMLNTIIDVNEFKDDITKRLENILKQIESGEASHKSIEQPINSELESKINNLSKEIDEHRKCLEQSQKELSRMKKSEEDKANLYKKDLEEKNKLLNKKQSELDEVKKQLQDFEKNISKDKLTQREILEKLNRKTTEADELKSKLKQNSAELNLIQQDQNSKYEKKVKKLESELSAALKDVERRTINEVSIGDQANKQADEIKTLQKNLSNAKNETDKLQAEVQRLRKESEEFSGLHTENSKLTDEIKRAEVENRSLREAVQDLENKLQTIELQAKNCVNAHEELLNLQKSDSERKLKIDNLELDLTKAHFQIKKLEEKICMDRKILKVRTSLIDSLQSKEETHKIRLQDLFAEVAEKTSVVQMLKSELLTKAEDFQNLFSTLSAKQLELTRQEHKIKLLQESNERAQNLRVKQEAKIANLEEELVHLKQMISLYQNAVLPNHALRENILMIEANRDNDFNECLSYYVDERRRKRHVDIKVKKYEK